jgi:hypothetical protein
VGKKTKRALEPLEELRELVALGDTNGTEPKKTDRRGMLRMAGAAVLGAAGVAALKAVPASAATGGNFILGSGNDASSITSLTASAGSPGLYVLAGPTGIEGVSGSGGVNEIGVAGGSKSGLGTGVVGQSQSGTGVHGDATTGTGVYGTATTGTGVLGSAPTNGLGVRGTAGGTGNAVRGEGVNGVGGFFWAPGGYDVQLGYPVPGGAVGSGRLAMVGRLDTGGSAPPINPAFVTTTAGSAYFEHELIRGNDSSIWASRFAGSGTSQSRWKRINAVRVDTADGLGGSFKPFRVKDTRLPSGSARKGANTMTVVPVAGLGTGASAIPGDAIAVIGNLTATAYTGSGFLAIMPAGIVEGTAPGNYNPASDPSSLNFITGQGAIANGFVCGLAGGSLQVWVGDHSSHFIVDITGYLQ